MAILFGETGLGKCSVPIMSLGHQPGWMQRLLDGRCMYCILYYAMVIVKFAPLCSYRFGLVLSGLFFTLCLWKHSGRQSCVMFGAHVRCPNG